MIHRQARACYRSIYMTLTSFVLLENLWHKSVNVVIIPNCIHLHLGYRRAKCKWTGTSAVISNSFPPPLSITKQNTKSLVPWEILEQFIENCPNSHKKHQNKKVRPFKSSLAFYNLLTNHLIFMHCFKFKVPSKFTGGRGLSKIGRNTYLWSRTD